LIVTAQGGKIKEVCQMEIGKNQDRQALNQIKRILSGLGPDSYIAKALMGTFAKEVGCRENFEAAVGLAEELRQVRLPEQFVRDHEAAAVNQRESLLRQLEEAEAKVTEIKARLYDLTAFEY